MILLGWSDLLEFYLLGRCYIHISLQHFPNIYVPSTNFQPLLFPNQTLQVPSTKSIKHCPSCSPFLSLDNTAGFAFACYSGVKLLGSVSRAFLHMHCWNDVPKKCERSPAFHMNDLDRIDKL